MNSNNKPSRHQIDATDCSKIGLLILEHMEKHQLTLIEMADKSGVSLAALRIAMLKDGDPGKRMIPQLARTLNVSEEELLHLNAENRLDMIYRFNS